MPAGQPYSVPPRGVGLPDYSAAKPVGQVPIGQVYTSTDIGELAVRLGSPAVFDRRGNIIWFDDFSHGISKWDHGGTAPASSSQWCTSEDGSNLGGFYLRLLTGAGAGFYRRIRRRIPYPVLSKMGFEISFAFKPVARTSLRFWFILYDGIHSYTMLADYNTESSLWTIGADFLAPDDTFTIPLYSDLGFYNTIKLVGDFTVGYWERLIINSISRDLTTKQLTILDDASTPHIELLIPIQNRAVGGCTVHFDTIIITQNEAASGIERPPYIVSPTPE